MRVWTMVWAFIDGGGYRTGMLGALGSFAV